MLMEVIQLVQNNVKEQVKRHKTSLTGYSKTSSWEWQEALLERQSHTVFYQRLKPNTGGKKCNYLELPKHQGQGFHNSTYDVILSRPKVRILG